MLSPAHRQPVQTEVPNHVRNGWEGSTKLAQDELAGFVVTLYSHVHESFCTPEMGLECLSLVDKYSCWRILLQGERIVLSRGFAVANQEASFPQRS